MSSSSPSKAATLHDVAREAGVSLITASRALSNPALVSDKTIARVRKAVELTGYIPNLLAGGLKSRRSLMVAGLVPTISVPQFLPTVKALTETLDAAGYQLILGQSGYDHSRDEKLLNTMLSQRVVHFPLMAG
ncbi:MAG: LacI family DNA-binding transcriptional regulator, partial [Ideonella sp.]